MSQHSMVIANLPGASHRVDLNNMAAALVSQNSGATAPATTYAFQMWADTTLGMLKIRNAANSGWITIGPLADLGIQTGAQCIATVGGTVDAITLTLSPVPSALFSGPKWWRAAGANATTTPTANTAGFGAKTMVKGNNLALAPGDIPGAGAWMCSQYDATLDKEVLLNPATGVVASTSKQIQSLPDPTLAGNAMTLPASTHTLDFRSATSGTGAVTTVSGTAAALVVPAGASLGHVNGVQGTDVHVIMNNGGTLEKAIINLDGGADLSEEGVISTTAISAGATSSNVFYSNTARTNLPYRVVQKITSTQATAGQWATNASHVQGQGGNALIGIPKMRLLLSVATTIGTAIDFTGLPSWVKRITVALNGVSTNGASLPQIQIGSGAIDATGYVSTQAIMQNSSSTVVNGSTTGFVFGGASASNNFRGIGTLVHTGGNVWMWSIAGADTTLANGYSGGGSKAALSGLLDRIRLTTVNGTDAYDAGSVTLLLEGY